MRLQGLEGRTPAHRSNQGGRGRGSQRRLDGKPRTSPRGSRGRGSKRAVEKGGRGRKVETPRRGREEEAGGKRKRRKREEEEKEVQVQGGEDSVFLGQEGFNQCVWVDRPGPRSGGASGGHTQSKEGEEKFKEKEKEEVFQRVKPVIQQQLVSEPGSQHGALRWRDGNPEAVEENTGGISLCNSGGGAAFPADQAGHSSRCELWISAPNPPAVLQDYTAAGDDPCFEQGGPSLGYDAGLDDARGHGSSSGSGVPKTQIPGRVRERRPIGCEPQIGASTSRQTQSDHPSRDYGCRKEALGGRKGKQAGTRDSQDMGWLSRWFRTEQERQWKRKREERRQAGLQREQRKGRGWKGKQERGLLEWGDEEQADRGEALKKRREEEQLEPGGIDPTGKRMKFSDEPRGELVTADTQGKSLGGSCLPKDGPEGLISLVQSFSDLMRWTWGKFKSLRKMQRVQLTTAQGKEFSQGKVIDIFPLPVPQESSSRSCGTIAALNDLAGHSPEAGSEDSSDVVSEIQKGLEKIVERFDIWEEERPEVTFEKLFTTKDLDYSGEEVKLAQQLNWKAVEKSLPDGVGCLPLQEFCTMGTLEYVLNFEKHLLPLEDLEVPRPPKVMVEPGSWEELCRGLVSKNICEVWPVDQVFHLRGEPVLNGLFAVGKGEYHDQVETQRLIMNLVPVNSMCRNLVGDVCTLPGLAGFSSFVLDENEVGLFSSEDIRCFFYLFSVPDDWKRYLGFNRLVPTSVVPPSFSGRDCVLVSRVLPMGFVNSVSIAQHIHRNIIRMSAMRCQPQIGGEREMRKDKGMSSSSNLFRIYLDNFDLVEKTDPATAALIEGTPAEQVLQLRKDYEAMGLPRHPKKAVERKLKAEVQGAIFDGSQGFAMAKPAKVWQYALLGCELLLKGRASLKELQVVCGGFVYVAMFRRPMLCALNEVWQFMQSYIKKRIRGTQVLPLQVQAEIARFILLMPLAQMEFRSQLCHQATCSDASTLGGGICVSEGLTAYGVAASNSQVRGDVPEQHDLCQVLTVGMFDGIGALRMAADTLGLPVAGHVSIEKDAHGRRVVESWFPDTTFFEDVCEFGESQVQELALRYTNVGLVIIGAGPPCQGVSKLNADKKGALRDERSSLFQEVPRVEKLFKEKFPWAQVHRLMESVASMSDEDRSVMSQGVDDLPFKIDCFGLTLCHRPRLYWTTWELVSGPSVVVTSPPGDEWTNFGTVSFFGSPQAVDLLEPGWNLGDEWGLPTFTTSRPRASPGRRPAGLASCAPHERQRWEQDDFRFPPYQYKDGAGLWSKKGVWRRPSVVEREALMGFPVGYTASCVPKGEQKKAYVDDVRLTLLGNSWQVGVIVWLLSQLCSPLGLCDAMSVADIVEVLTPGRGSRLQSLLMRPPLHRPGSVRQVSSQGLLRKLMGIVSMKGEDLLLQASSESLVRYHRLRSSIPAKLWKWRTVAGWQWKSSGEHINILEMRAILTSVRWWVRSRRLRSSRFLHLTDSLVCLHCLSRGRTSSRKLRRTLIRINALLLATDLHPVWGYIHTSQNPADRPSRRPFRKKWVRWKSTLKVGR